MWGCDMLPFRVLVGEGEGDHETAEGSKDQSFPGSVGAVPSGCGREPLVFHRGCEFVTEQNWMRPVGSRRFCPCGVMDKRAFHAVLRRAFRGACGTEEELFPREYEEQFRLEGEHDPPGYGGDAVPAARNGWA